MKTFQTVKISICVSINPFQGVQRLLTLFLYKIFGSFLFQFPIAAVADHCNLGGSKQHKFIILHLLRTESDIKFTEQKPRGQQDFIHLWRLRGKSIVLLFPDFIGYLHSVACGPILSSKTARIFIVSQCITSYHSNSAPVITCSFLIQAFLLFSSTFKDLCDDSGPTWTNQAPLPNLRSTIVIPLQP